MSYKIGVSKMQKNSVSQILAGYQYPNAMIKIVEIRKDYPYNIWGTFLCNFTRANNKSAKIVKMK